MFTRVLIANRGEIVGRVASTLRRLGIESVVVYTAADEQAEHRAVGDIAVPIADYLDGPAIVAAAIDSGAEAIHPGYGFLSENAGFAEACAAAGLVFIGPRPETIRLMGDKIAAKAAAAAARVTVVPGGGQAGMSDEQLADIAIELGAPVLLKPAAGGGGKGMHLIDQVDDRVGVLDTIATARREAARAFADDTLLVERYVTSPHHVEVQILGDTHGNVIHLGERDCTLQRRHQKVVEETPSPLIDDDQRRRLCAQAVALAEGCGYVGAGTVEFVVSADEPDHAYFMEMNTRLQVEHPVTEEVTGVDLVEQQLRIAAGQRLAVEQDAIAATGHAIEARVYAEDPRRGFLPTGGTVLRFDPPAGVRVDAGIAAGSVVGSSYDPMLAKVIVHGADRAAALAALEQALAATVIHGVVTNLDFLRRLVSDPAVAAGDYDTGFIEAHLDELTAAEPGDGWAEQQAAAALVDQARRRPSGLAEPWASGRAWRLGGGEGVPVLLAGADQRAALITVDASTSPTAAVTITDEAVWVTGPAGTTVVGRPGHGGARRGVAGDGTITSPMPGTVVSIAVEVGQRIDAGAVVAVVEAMKMEHRLEAPFAADVVAVEVSAGDQVGVDQVLVRLEEVER